MELAGIPVLVNEAAEPGSVALVRLKPLPRRADGLLPVSAVGGTQWPQSLGVGDRFALEGDEGRLDVRIVSIDSDSVGDPKRATAEVERIRSGLLKRGERIPFPGWGGRWAKIAS